MNWTAGTTVNAMQTRDEIIQLIRDKRTQLPTLSVVLDNILQIASDDRTSAQDLAEFIQQDQAIAHKILRLANSAYYGLARKVDSIARAITIIGFNEVVGLTLGMGMFSTLGQRTKQSGLDMRGLWLHSIGCGSACRILGTRMGHEEPNRLFICGLLHDTGKVLLAAYFPDDYERILDMAAGNGIALHLVERDQLGLDHAEVGGLLMEQWHFPSSLVLPCRHHHDDSDCPPDLLLDTAVVVVGNAVADKAEIGQSGNPAANEADHALDRLGLSSANLDELSMEILEKRERMEGFLEAAT
jgi:HD-like signal output (HDOD) protein